MRCHLFNKFKSNRNSYLRKKKMKCSRVKILFMKNHLPVFCTKMAFHEKLSCFFFRRCENCFLANFIYWNHILAHEQIYRNTIWWTDGNPLVHFVFTFAEWWSCLSVASIWAFFPLSLSLSYSFPFQSHYNELRRLFFLHSCLNLVIYYYLTNRNVKIIAIYFSKML